MKVRKNTLENVIRGYHASIAGYGEEIKLNSIKAKETEELGQTIIDIEAKETRIQEIWKGHSIKADDIVNYIYHVEDHALLNGNWEVIFRG